MYNKELVHKEIDGLIQNVYDLQAENVALKANVEKLTAFNSSSHEMPSYEEVSDAVFGHCGACGFVNEKSDFAAVKKAYEYIARHFGH